MSVTAAASAPLQPTVTPAAIPQPKPVIAAEARPAPVEAGVPAADAGGIQPVANRTTAGALTPADAQPLRAQLTPAGALDTSGIDLRTQQRLNTLGVSLDRNAGVWWIRHTQESSGLTTLPSDARTIDGAVRNNGDVVLTVNRGDPGQVTYTFDTVNRRLVTEGSGTRNDRALPYAQSELTDIWNRLKAGDPSARVHGTMHTVTGRSIAAFRTLFPGYPAASLGTLQYVQLNHPISSESRGQSRYGMAFVSPGAPPGTVHNELVETVMWNRAYNAFSASIGGGRAMTQQQTNDALRRFDDDYWRGNWFRNAPPVAGVSIGNNTQARELVSDAAAMADPTDIYRVVAHQGGSDPNHNYHATVQFARSLVHRINDARGANAIPRAELDALISNPFGADRQELVTGLRLTQRELWTIRQEYLRAGRVLTEHYNAEIGRRFP